MKCYPRPVRKYYKYIYTPWSQPTLSDFGAFKGASFAVAQSSCYSTEYLWHLFASTPSQWHSAAGATQWVSWYNPKPLKISKLFFAGHSAGNIKDFIIQGSVDNIAWTDIVSYSNTNSTGDFEVAIPANTPAYQFWRIYITSCYYYSGGNPYPLIAPGFTIYGEEVTIAEATEYDYDYYVDYKEYRALPTNNYKDNFMHAPHIYYDNTHKLAPDFLLTVPAGSNSLWIAHPDYAPYTAFRFNWNWEFQLKILRTTGTESFFRIWHLGTYYRAIDWYEYSGDFRIATGHAPNQSWTDHYWSSDGIPFNKWVWIRLKKTGAHYVCSQSLDGITYRDKVAFDHAFDWPFWAIQLMEGAKGIIDLKESYIKQWPDNEADAEYWWTGLQLIKARKNNIEQQSVAYTKYEMAGNYGD